MTAIRLHTSALLSDADFAIVHGFPERSGGVSTGLRASLNLGTRWGDARANVDENRRRLANFAGYDADALVAMRHVHGTAVWAVGEAMGESAEFDGLVCDRPGPVLGAFSADCVPMLFVDPVAQVIGAAHAGWRGAIGAALPGGAGSEPSLLTSGQSVASNVIRRMVERGAQAAQIRVALGPSIGPCCFEVGAEVAAQFRDALGDVAGLVITGANKPHVDLRIALRAVLERTGVRSQHIDDNPPCTKCHPDRFFSYRRDGVEGGVHMAFISIRG